VPGTGAQRPTAARKNQSAATNGGLIKELVVPSSFDKLRMRTRQAQDEGDAMLFSRRRFE